MVYFHINLANTIFLHLITTNLSLVYIPPFLNLNKNFKNHNKHYILKLKMCEIKQILLLLEYPGN